MVPLAIEKIGIQVSKYIPLKISIYINIYTHMHQLFIESVAQFGREELYYYHKNSKSKDCTIQVYPTGSSVPSRLIWQIELLLQKGP